MGLTTRVSVAASMALLLVVGGCEGEPEGEDVLVREDATSPQAPVPPTVVPMELVPLNDSEVQGQVNLVEEDRTSTRINVILTGVMPDSVIAGHLHRGSCGNVGSGLGTEAEFGPVGAGQPGEDEGDGTQSAVVPIPLDQLRGGGYALTLHYGDEEHHVACVDLGG